jgi:signal transduction histidine kinase/ligand-binding sensor domain-containing protein/CheY-like chemotaxis protein
MKPCEFLFILALILGTTRMHGQQQMTYHINHLSIEEGLPHVDAYDILEDERGFIWIATLSGLCKFDGYSVNTYSLSSSGGVDRERCNSLALGANHILWVGTQGGLSMFDMEKEEVIPFLMEDSYWQYIRNSDVNIHLLDSGGDLWITVDNQLLRLDMEGREIFRVENLTGIMEYTEPLVINAMVEDRNSNVWIGSNQGIFQIAPVGDLYSLLAHFSSDAGDIRLEEDYTSALSLDPQGNLMIGSVRLAEVLRLDYSRGPESIPVELISLKVEEPLMDQQEHPKRFTKIWHLRSASFDSRNNCWFATDGGILKLEADSAYAAYRFTFFGKSESLPNSLSSDIIQSLFINREDCLFAGTYGGGVNYFDTRQKEIYWLRKDFEDPTRSLSENLVRAIEEDEQGNVWIGTQNSGLNYYDLKSGTIQQVDLGTNRQGINRNLVRALKLEGPDCLWVGTLNEFFCYDIKRKKIVELPEAIQERIQIDHGYVTDMDIDAFGNLWVSTWGTGIFRCIRSSDDPLSFDRIELLNEEGTGAAFLSTTDVNSIRILENPREIMVGTRHELVHYFLNADGRISSYRIYTTRQHPDQGRQGDFIWDIVPHGAATYYVGSIGKGLLKLDLKTDPNSGSELPRLERIELPEQYKLTDIESLLKDDQGNLWLAGKGLYFFNTTRETLEEQDFDQAVFKNMFKVGAACKGKSGRLYFGGTRGVSYFSPEAIQANSRIPGVELIDLRVHNQLIRPGMDYAGKTILQKSLAFTDRITLNYLQNDFTLSFSSMQFQNPDKSRFRYKLEGYDKDWNLAYGDMPFASYANLKFRKYRFIIYASNSDGLWSFEPRILHISITPPWWKSRLALFIYFWIIILVVFGIYYNQSRFYRMKHDLAISKLEDQKKEELHQMKLRFFTNISHEFRTPISLILAPLEELKVGGQNQAGRTRLYRVIEQNARKLLRLINELIEFRKLESEAFQLRTSFMELNGLVKASLEQFEPLAKRKGIDLNLEPSGEYVKSWFDPYVIERVVSNILSNAIKYTPESGSVQIRVLNGDLDKFTDSSIPHHVIGSTEESVHYAGILIRDSGEGINPEELPYIFDRYFQEASKSDKNTGSGIGLSIVKNLILLHKGQIIAASEKGKGSSFTIKLPISQEFEQYKQQGDVIRRGSSQVIGTGELLGEDRTFDGVIAQKYRNTRVMVVEDEDDMRSYLESRLSAGFIVRGFSRASEALTMMEEFTPDLVISDIMMPGMNGFDFCRALKRNPNTSHIPVILLTAKTATEDLIKGAESLADLYVPKPFEMHYLLVSINNLLENRRNLMEKYKDNIHAQYGKYVKEEKEKELMDKVITIIRENMANPAFNVDFIASEVGIGRTKMYKLIKDITGFTLGELIRDVKMKTALQLMLTTDNKISQIAMEVGISPNFFYSMFKDYYGKTPSEYLKEHQ